MSAAASEANVYWSALPRLVPVVKRGSTYIQDIETQLPDEEAVCPPELEALLKSTASHQIAPVSVESISYQATVYNWPDEASEDVGYVLVDEFSVPTELDPSDSNRITSAESAISGQELAYESHLNELYERIRSSEAPAIGSSVPLTSRYVRPTLSGVPDQTTFTDSMAPRRPLRWHTALANRRLLVLGEPGGGKTSLLRMVALQSSSQSESKLVPVYLQLRDLESPTTLHKQSYQWLLRSEIRPFDAAAKMGRLVLLLDGLDEVYEPNRGAMISAINEMVGENPHIRVIASCRTSAYSGGLHDFQAMEIEPFGREQIREWVVLNAPREAAEPFLDRVELDTDLTQLARSPLMLSVMTNYSIRYRSDHLHSNKAELIGSLIELLADQWDRERGIRRVQDEITSSEVMRILAEASFRAMARGRDLFTESDLRVASRDLSSLHTTLRIIDESTGLIRRSDDGWRFSSAAVGQYFAALYLINRTDDSFDSTVLRRFLKGENETAWQISCQMTSDPSDLLGSVFRSKLSEMSKTVLLASAVSYDLPLTAAILEKVVSFAKKATARLYARRRLMSSDAADEAQLSTIRAILARSPSRGVVERLLEAMDLAD